MIAIRAFLWGVLGVGLGGVARSVAENAPVYAESAGAVMVALTLLAFLLQPKDGEAEYEEGLELLHDEPHPETAPATFEGFRASVVKHLSFLVQLRAFINTQLDFERRFSRAIAVTGSIGTVLWGFSAPITNLIINIGA